MGSPAATVTVPLEPCLSGDAVTRPACSCFIWKCRRPKQRANSNCGARSLTYLFATRKWRMRYVVPRPRSHPAGGSGTKGTRSAESNAHVPGKSNRGKGVTVKQVRFHSDLHLRPSPVRRGSAAERMARRCGSSRTAHGPPARRAKPVLWTLFGPRGNP